MTPTRWLIEKLHFRGAGLALPCDCDNHSRRFVHIANALPGERVLAQEVSQNNDLPNTRRRFACLTEVIDPSPNRCLPHCKHWMQCPACQFQCLKYDAQTQVKFDNWIKLFSRFFSLPDQVSFVPAPSLLHYRHRTEVLLSNNILGILPRPEFQWMDNAPNPQSPQTIPMKDCALHAQELNDLINKVEQILPDCAFPGDTRLSLESNTQTDSPNRITVYSMPEFSAQARIAAEILYQKTQVPVVFQQLPPRGSHVYPKPDHFGDSPWYGYDSNEYGECLYAMKGAWTPVNPPNAHLIRDTLKKLIEPYRFRSVLELGCGCGTHTAVFRNHAENYVGIDASWPAIQSAQHNAALHHWENVNFYTDTAEHYLDKRYYGGRRADTILMHSNRLPYSKSVAEMSKRFGAIQIFIVAPTAYAMAQECRHFSDLGYKLKSLHICDTLPMTYHQMAVAHLVLQNQT